MDEKRDGWFHACWRPGMAWLYMVICAFDFLIAPLLTMIEPSWFPALKGIPTWKPITLAEGGFVHLAFMTILGITAWTRGQEKIVKAEIGEDRRERRRERSIKDEPTE